MENKAELVEVMGRRWDSSRPNFFAAPEGMSLESIVFQSLEKAYRDKVYTRAQYRSLLRYARVRVNGVEIDRKFWKEHFPQKGDRIEVLHGVRGGGGGGGKNPVATILSVIVVIIATIATWWAGGLGGQIALGALTVQMSTFATTMIGLVTVGMLYAINALFPATPPSAGGAISNESATKESQTYSITGGRNAHNVNGYVPLVLGRHKLTPPLGAKSWTVWEGDAQFFNMLVVWGHPDIEVTDFKIGDTALSSYADVDHKFHQSTTGSDLIYFAKQYNETSVGTVLKHSDGWTTRTVGEANDLSIDIAFSGGLVRINQQNGNKEWREVSLTMQYKATDSDNWINLPTTIERRFGETRITSKTDDRPSVWVTKNGGVQFNSGFLQLWPNKDARINGGGVSWKELTGSMGSAGSDSQDGWYWEWHEGWEATVRSGSFKVDGNGEFQVGDNRQKQIVKNVRIEGLELRSYDVRIKRNTGDTDDSYIIDEATWSTMRAIVNQPAFDTPVPICVSELRIRASEQLSGYVTDFSGICHSKVPDWDASQNKWVAKATSNPASLMRYVLTSKHCLAKPFAESRLDDESLVGLWNWCNDNGYRFDYVCDAEEPLWQRLVSILAPAQAAPTTDVDGLWGAIWDSPDKTVKQMFTPRNSWGMSVSRSFAQPPHALRVSFVDENDDWKSKEGFVFNDGYSKDGADGTVKADDVQAWEFPGVTNWERIYKLARYHFAQILHRQVNITLNTDWEWLAVHRGDLVGVSSDVLMNTFGTARITRLAYRSSNFINETKSTKIPENIEAYTDTDGAVILVGSADEIPLNPNGTPMDPLGVEIDDTVVFSEPAPARYGIAVRTPTGSVNIFEITPQYGEESSVLWFYNRVPAANAPAFGSLVSVSLLGSEYEEYLVSSITPGDNLSAQLSLVPWKTKEIRASVDQPVPPYEAPVVLDVVKGTDNLPTPTITNVASDEGVVLVSQSGSFTMRVGAWWTLPPTSAGLTWYTVQCVLTDRETGEELTGSATSSDQFVAVPVGGDAVGKSYYVKLRIADPTTGRVSGWSNVVTHKVVGLTAPPPVPENFRAVLDVARGVVLLWNPVDVLDLSHYEISGAASGRTKGKETEYAYEPWGQTGTLEYELRSRDLVGTYSGKAVLTSVEIREPEKVVFTGARLGNDGIELEYEDARTTWPIAEYAFECGTSSGSSASYYCTLPVPSNFNGGTARGRARDKFGTWGQWSSFVDVEVRRPKTPELRLDVLDNGTAVFAWQDCREWVDIQHYVLSGASTGTTTGLYITLDIGSILWTEGGAAEYSYRIGQVTERCTAVDKYGFESETAVQTHEILPPKNPVLEIAARADGLHLEWQDCKGTFRIDRYDVYDSGADGESKIYFMKGCSQLLKPRKSGYYNFSVKAFDCLGLASSEMEIADYYVHGPADPVPAAVIDGSDVLLAWERPTSDFPIDFYRVFSVSGEDETLLGEAKTLWFRLPAPGAGGWTYRIQSVDLAGNESAKASVSITIKAPAAPVVSAVLSGDGIDLSWKAGEDPSVTGWPLPVAAWDVARQWEDGQYVREQDYGRLDVDTLRVPAVIAGVHTFHVRAVDTSGTTGSFGTCEFEALRPGKVSFSMCAAVDNNVMLYWTEPDEIFFPVAWYLFETDMGQGDGIFAEAGRIDALFASSFESVSGRYVYRITPVDTAGNMGTPSQIAVDIAQPPDFILYHDYDSLFNGTKTNFVLDGRGSMIGPFSNSTWQEQLNAMASAKGTTAANITWNQKKGWGWTHWMDPEASSATYVETVDVGVIIPATKVNITYTAEKLTGTPAFTCQIEVSSDNSQWRTMTEDGWMVYATDFRYVRYTIGLTGGTAAVSNINCRLDVKKMTDFGHVTCNASDNGTGWVSMAQTPMLTGTWVPFNVEFNDVESLPRPNVVANASNGSTVGYTAYTVFEDVLHPQGFRVFVLDSNGNRVTADVDWSAFGV